MLLFTCGCQDDTSHELDKLVESSPSADIPEYDSLYVPIEVATQVALHLNEYGILVPEVVNARRKEKKEKKIKSSKTIKDRKERDAFYIFNYEQDEGFAIIAADERVMPVLEHGETNFALENPGLAYWFLPRKTTLLTYVMVRLIIRLRIKRATPEALKPE